MEKKKESFERESSQWVRQKMNGMERWVSYYRLLFGFGNSGKSQGTVGQQNCIDEKAAMIN